jgi:hypothetical protein
VPGGQTREHAALARSLGVEQVAVVVSKLDTVAYDQVGAPVRAWVGAEGRGWEAGKAAARAGRSALGASPAMCLCAGARPPTPHRGPASPVWRRQGRFEAVKAALLPYLRSVGFREAALTWLPASGPLGENLVAAPAVRGRTRTCRGRQGPCALLAWRSFRLLGRAASPAQLRPRPWLTPRLTRAGWRVRRHCPCPPACPQDPALAAWWRGPTLVEAIDAFAPRERATGRPLRMPVTDVFKNRAGGRAGERCRGRRPGVQPRSPSPDDVGAQRPAAAETCPASA